MAKENDMVANKPQQSLVQFNPIIKYKLSNYQF